MKWENRRKLKRVKKLLTLSGILDQRRRQPNLRALIYCLVNPRILLPAERKDYIYSKVNNCYGRRGSPPWRRCRKVGHWGREKSWEEKGGRGRGKVGGGGGQRWWRRSRKGGGGRGSELWAVREEREGFGDVRVSVLQKWWLAMSVLPQHLNEVNSFYELKLNKKMFKRLKAIDFLRD